MIYNLNLSVSWPWPLKVMSVWKKSLSKSYTVQELWPPALRGGVSYSSVLFTGLLQVELCEVWKVYKDTLYITNGYSDDLHLEATAMGEIWHSWSSPSMSQMRLETKTNTHTIHIVIPALCVIPSLCKFPPEVRSFSSLCLPHMTRPTNACLTPQNNAKWVSVWLQVSGAHVGGSGQMALHCNPIVVKTAQREV